MNPGNEIINVNNVMALEIQEHNNDLKNIIKSYSGNKDEFHFSLRSDYHGFGDLANKKVGFDINFNDDKFDATLAPIPTQKTTVTPVNLTNQSQITPPNTISDNDDDLEDDDDLEEEKKTDAKTKAKTEAEETKDADVVDDKDDKAEFKELMKALRDLDKNVDTKIKYLKYKQKYLDLKESI